jgi:pimeloyl-ACP methyl ester carboxylesterase
VLVGALTTLLAVVAVAAWVPPVRARAKAVAVVARSVGIPFPRPFAARVSVRHLHPGPWLQADLYWPGGPAPGIVLAPGGDPQGKDDPRLVRVARSLAGAGRAVLVPQLDLRLRTFEWADVRRIVASAQALRRVTANRSVGLLGFSYGGSFCLLAAEQPDIGPLAFVGVFGAFDRLLDVVQGITTGATILDGRVVPWTTVPEAHAILRSAALGLAAPADRGPLAAALRNRSATGLDPPARAIYDLLANTDPRMTAPLAGRLPAPFREALDRFSPSTRLGRVRAPVYVMQSLNDPATPPTEAVLFHRSLPGSRLIVLHWFLHVMPPGHGTPLRGYLQDGWGAWKFVSWVLSTQE